MKYSLQEIARSETKFYDFITSGKLSARELNPKKTGRLFGPRTEQHPI